jgi:hypothetical protein
MRPSYDRSSKIGVWKQGTLVTVPLQHYLDHDIDESKPGAKW